MKLSDQDDLAELAFGLAKRLPKQEAKEAIASMYDVDQDRAWALFVRGKHLARIRGEVV